MSQKNNSCSCPCLRCFKKLINFLFQKRKRSQKIYTIDKRRNGRTASAETETLRRVTRAEGPLYQLCDELLPGIPNEVTLQHIASTLPRRACEVLTEVSREWQLAFQHHMVYDARVREGATKKYFLVQCNISTGSSGYFHGYGNPDFFWKYILSLYSQSERCWYNLPTIPSFRTGMPDSCKSVFLNGSIYVLGGTTNPMGKGVPIADVYVLDLAGHQLEWRRCASMKVPRMYFTAAVMDKRIFVFGGERKGMNFSGGEVYDQIDAWSWIKPTVFFYSQVYEVFTVGEQFVVCSKPVSDDEAASLLEEDAGHDKDNKDLSISETSVDTKFQVKISPDGYPKLIRTSDDDAEDELDGVHKLIETHEYVQQYLDFWKDDIDKEQLVEEDIASHVESKIEYHERRNDFVGAYDPVKDEWREVERESLDIGRVDIARWPKPYYYLDLGNYAGFKMWKVSL